MRELNKEEQHYVLYTVLNIALNITIEGFEIEGQVLRLGVGVGVTPKVHEVLSRKLKAREQLARLDLSRKKLNGFRKFWNINLFIVLKDV